MCAGALLGILGIILGTSRSWEYPLGNRLDSLGNNTKIVAGGLIRSMGQGGFGALWQTPKNHQGETKWWEGGWISYSH